MTGALRLLDFLDASGSQIAIVCLPLPPQISLNGLHDGLSSLSQLIRTRTCAHRAFYTISLRDGGTFDDKFTGNMDALQNASLAFSIIGKCC